MLPSHAASPQEAAPQHRGSGGKAVETLDIVEGVDIRPLCGRDDGPVEVAARCSGTDLRTWAASHGDWLKRCMRLHRGALFRGFAVEDAGRFREFASTASDDRLMEYRDRSTPRVQVAERIYTSTTYPPGQRINLHNEGTYWNTWPRTIFFFCRTPARTGGRTPVADVHRVYRRIAPRVRDEFVGRGVTYVRNYNDGFGLPWQETFQTDDPAEVERWCRGNDIDFEWKDGGRLRTRQTRPAVRNDPVAGRPLWFNHGAFFHLSALPMPLRGLFAAGFAPEDLPFHTTFGDGAPIPDEDVAHVLDAYRAEEIVFDWLAGDVLMLDNMAFAHGREPYSGAREVLAALAEPYSEPDGGGAALR